MSQPTTAITSPHRKTAEFDELDPHGFEKGHAHSHFIVGTFTLRTVLIALLALTALTIGLAQFEIWIQGFLDIHLPWWVNVIGAMTIAVIKSFLVMAFFMQLRYDNPLNTILMLFCFFALALFLFFTGLDLFSRNRIYEFKAGPIVAGGTGTGVNKEGKPIVTAARERAIAAWGPERYEQIRQEIKSHGHGGHAAGRTLPASSTASQSRPRLGPSDALTAVAAPADASHGTTHGHEDGVDRGQNTGVPNRAAPVVPDQILHSSPASGGPSQKGMTPRHTPDAPVPSQVIPEGTPSKGGH